MGSFAVGSSSRHAGGNPPRKASAPIHTNSSCLPAATPRTQIRILTSQQVAIASKIGDAGKWSRKESAISSTGAELESKRSCASPVADDDLTSCHSTTQTATSTTIDHWWTPELIRRTLAKRAVLEKSKVVVKFVQVRTVAGTGSISLCSG